MNRCRHTPGVPVSYPPAAPPASHRRLVIALAATAALAAAAAIVWAATGQNAVGNAVSYVGDATGIAPANEEVAAQIDEHTTFQSTPNATWEEAPAGGRVPLLVSNPAGNPVDLAPHVYIDCNDDGELTADECVWNAPAFDDAGTMTDCGSFLEPGTEVEAIELLRAVPAGTHEGAVQYTAVHAATGQPANGMTMRFSVRVGS